MRRYRSRELQIRCTRTLHFPFQESDRRVLDNRADPNEPLREVEYAASREEILHRLDILGCTADAAATAFREWHADEVQMYREWVADGSDWAWPGLTPLEGLTFEECGDAFRA